jgi:hypothetical protein
MRETDPERIDHSSYSAGYDSGVPSSQLTPNSSARSGAARREWDESPINPNNWVNPQSATTTNSSEPLSWEAGLVVLVFFGFLALWLISAVNKSEQQKLNNVAIAAAQAKVYDQLVDGGSLALIEKLKNATIKGEKIGVSPLHNLEFLQLKNRITDCGEAIGTNSISGGRCIQRTNVTQAANAWRTSDAIIHGRDVKKVRPQENIIWLDIVPATTPPRAAVFVKVYLQGSESSPLISGPILRNDQAN